MATFNGLQLQVLTVLALLGAGAVVLVIFVFIDLCRQVVEWRREAPRGVSRRCRKYLRSVGWQRTRRW